MATMETDKPLEIAEENSVGAVSRFDETSQRTLIIFVEGKEDKNIVRCLLTEIRKDLEASSICEKRTLLQMLYGPEIQMVLLNGKGALCVKHINRYLKVNVCHCIILDADALFKKGSAMGIKKHNSIWETKLSSFRGKWKWNPWEGKTPDYLNSLLSGGLITNHHYLELNPESGNDSMIQQFQSQDDSITVNRLIDIYQKIARIFVWKHNNGTTSGVFGLNKKEVIKSKDTDDGIIKHIRETCEKEPAVKKELQRFKHFLFNEVFIDYNKTSAETIHKNYRQHEETYVDLQEKRKQRMQYPPVCSISTQAHDDNESLRPSEEQTSIGPGEQSRGTDSLTQRSYFSALLAQAQCLEAPASLAQPQGSGIPALLPQPQGSGISALLAQPQGSGISALLPQPKGSGISTSLPQPQGSGISAPTKHLEVPFSPAPSQHLDVSIPPVQTQHLEVTFSPAPIQCSDVPGSPAPTQHFPEYGLFDPTISHIM